MKKGNYENGAVLLENGTVLEAQEINIYDNLEMEIDKLIRNVEGLGKKEVPNGTTEEVRAKGLEVLKNSYSTAYNKQVRVIGDLANQYIRSYCFFPLFYKDAADTMLVSPIEVITGYIKDKTPDIRKSLFTDYSVDEFTKICDGIREKVTALAILNWGKHMELNKGKK